MRGEDLCVRLQQVLALHARSARAGADQERHLAVAKRHARIVRGRHAAEHREGTVLELHHHPLQRGERRGDLQQVQVDAGVGTECITGGHAEGEGITDLAGRAGDRNVHGFHGRSLSLEAKRAGNSSLSLSGGGRTGHLARSRLKR